MVEWNRALESVHLHPPTHTHTHNLGFMIQDKGMFFEQQPCVLTPTLTPKLLQCLHVSCQQCLVPLVDRKTKLLCLEPMYVSSNLLEANFWLAGFNFGWLCKGALVGLSWPYELRNVSLESEMAEEVLKKFFEEQLNCSICLDPYTDPKLLQCLHVYCRQCLVPLVDRDQQGRLGLSCPTCRQVTPIPDRGVAGLQPAFHINHLLEVQESLQKVQNPAATQEESVREPEIAKSSVRSCFEHPEEDLKLYCETCGELVCVQCVVKGGKHHDHDCAGLKKAFEKYNEEIASYLEPMEKEVMAAERALAQLDARCGEINDQRPIAEDNIHVTFRRLREVLNVRETELIGRLHELTQEKLQPRGTR